MAKRKSEMENEVDDTLLNWVCVNRLEEPMEWQAWINWRRDNMGSRITPENLTVPTAFPPVTVSAAKQYLETVTKIRRLNGWTGGKAKLTTDPSAWMGEI